MKLPRLKAAVRSGCAELWPHSDLLTVSYDQGSHE
jgi:hypothetical protein